MLSFTFDIIQFLQFFLFFDTNQGSFGQHLYISVLLHLPQTMLTSS